VASFLLSQRKWQWVQRQKLHGLICNDHFHHLSSIADEPSRRTPIIYIHKSYVHNLSVATIFYASKMGAKSRVRWLVYIHSGTGFLALTFSH